MYFFCRNIIFFIFSYFFVVLFIRVVLLIVTSFKIIFPWFRRKQVFFSKRLVGSDNKSHSLFPQSLLSVKDDKNFLLLTASSNFPNIIIYVEYCRHKTNSFVFKTSCETTKCSLGFYLCNLTQDFDLRDPLWNNFFSILFLNVALPIGKPSYLLPELLIFSGGDFLEVVF